MDAETIVIHFTSDDVEDWRQTLNNVSNLYREATSDAAAADMVLVVNGPAIRFLMESGSERSLVQQMLAGAVTIRACENSLERFGHNLDGLVDGIETVPSGVEEVVRLQRAGASYLKLP